jgi:predicted Zn-dependent protease
LAKAPGEGAAVKRGLIITTTVLLAGLAWVLHGAWMSRRADALHRAADEACRRFDFAAAHERLAAYLKVRPKDAAAYLLAARCARRAEFVESFAGSDAELPELASGHLDMAERLGAEASAVELERTLARVQHGRLAGDEGPLIERVKRGGPDAPLILEALIHGLLRNLQCEKALVCAEALLKLEPENVLALLWRGRIREQLRQPRSAREDYERVIHLVPRFDAARYYLAESLLHSHQPNEAAPHLRALNATAPDNLLVRLAWARCRVALGDGAAGRRLLDSWLADAPKDHPRMLEALTARAGLARAQGRPAEAEGFARRALQVSPLDQYALYHLAQSLRALGRRREARAAEGQLRKIKGDLRLVARCRQRLVQDPTDLRLRHEIGAAYLRVGRPGEALVWLNSVLDREPNHRPTLRTLADFHARAGHQALAGELRRRLSGSP